MTGVLRGSARIAGITGVGLVTAGRLTPALGRRLAGGSSEVFARRCGQQVSQALWRLGPAFVKLGQMLSSRQDVLPPAFCAELQTALARGAAGRTGQDGAEIEIGSVATVTRTRIDGVEVAVKRLHPGAARQLDLDVSLVRGFVRLLRRTLLRRSAMPLPQIVEEMCASIERQTDLRAEARTLDRLAPLAERLPVALPRVLHEHSDEHQLVMTWLPGQPDQPAPGGRSAKRLVLALYEMLFITGMVHCDLHPGNWWELPDGRIALVDAGFAYELDDAMRSHFAEFFLGMSSANADICATHALAACAVPVSREQEEGFRRDLAELILSTSGLTAGSFSLSRFATRFFRIQRRHEAYSRATFVYPFMALLAIEGQVKRLDPGLNFQSLAAPVVLRAIVNRSRTGSSDPTATQAS